jgi:hypothetical protein
MPSTRASWQIYKRLHAAPLDKEEPRTLIRHTSHSPGSGVKGRHSPAPIGLGPPKRDAHTAGYYVLVYADTRDRTGRSGREMA